MQTVVALDPALPLAALAIAPGGSRSAGAAPAGTEFDLAALYPGAIGGLRTAGSFADPRNALTTALLLLGGTGIGAFQEAGGFDQQAQAIRAYAVTRKL